MNKFQSLIQANSKETLSNRAKLLVSSTENKMAQVIFEMEITVNELKMQIEQLTDVAPENTYDLRPGGKGFDPAKWVNSLIDFKNKLYALELKLEIAKEAQSEWFETIKN